MLACVLSILKHDISGFSENLQKVCEGYGRTDNPYISAKAKKDWYLAIKDKMLGEFCKDIVEKLT